MDKLTLRQFADVVKALLEAGLAKYNVRLEIIEDVDGVFDDEMQVSIRVEKEKSEEHTEKGKTGETYSCSYNSNAYFFDMNENYHDYEARISRGEEAESDILRDIAQKMLKSILKEMEEEPQVDEEGSKKNVNVAKEAAEPDGYNECDNNDMEENAEDAVLVCKCIMKTALVCAAIPIGILIAKHYFCDKK